MGRKGKVWERTMIADEPGWYHMSYDQNPQKALRDLQAKTALNDQDKSLLQYLLAMKASYDESDKRYILIKEKFRLSEREPIKSQYYDYRGNSISMWEWSELDRWKKHISETHTNGYYISTVYLGIEHGFRNDKPIIFETMIFAEWKKLEGSEIDHYQERHCTEEEAFMGHVRAVNRVMNYV